MKYARGLVVCLIFLLSVACSIDPVEMKWAEDRCKTNDGLDYLFITGPGDMTAVCNNGGRFEGER